MLPARFSIDPSASGVPLVVARPSESKIEALNSWKEIAAYLNRGVRTVQRWEHNLNLPVHRIGKGKRSPVFSKIGEIDFWLSRTEPARYAASPHSEQLRASSAYNPALERLRRLRLEMRDLSQAVAENSVRQRVQAEILRAHLAAMKSRIKPL
jgi:hypothetical protein